MENNKLFVYGILKRGYELDLTNYGAKFIGEAYIEGATLYGIGPRDRWETVRKDGIWQRYQGVGLRLNTYPWSEGDPSGVVAHGELWEVPPSLWRWLDDIEQNGRVYTRKIVPVMLELKDAPTQGEWGAVMANAKAVTLADAWVYEHCYKDFKYENRIEGGRF